MTSTALLADLRAEVRGREESVVREWAGIVEWAAGNTLTEAGAEAAGAATIRDGFVDTGLPIAGEGAPLVSEFALMELIAVLGRSPDGGRVYVGRVLECAWRLPQVYASVVAGRLAPGEPNGSPKPPAPSALRPQPLSTASSSTPPASVGPSWSG